MSTWNLVRGVSKVPVTPNVRVAAVSIPQSPACRSHFSTVLAHYEPLVQHAANAGARIVVLPAAHVVLDDASYEIWLARVRHWARQGQIWLVLGYEITGFDSHRRLLAIDPAGNLCGGCAERASTGLMAVVTARFSADLTFQGWYRGAWRWGGLVAVPCRGAPSRPLAAFIAVMTGTCLVVASEQGCLIWTRYDSLLSKPRATGRVLVADLQVSGG